LANRVFPDLTETFPEFFFQVSRKERGDTNFEFIHRENVPLKHTIHAYTVWMLLAMVYGPQSLVFVCSFVFFEGTRIEHERFDGTTD
jgi:hypothetical protein